MTQVATSSAASFEARSTGYRNWVLSAFLFSVIALELQGMSVGTNLGTLFLLSLALLLTADRLLLSRSIVRWELHDTIYLATCALSLVSMFWSVAPRATIIGAIPQFAMFAVSLSLWRAPMTEAIRRILMAALIISVLSLATIAISPSFAFQPSSSTGAEELRGVFKHQLRLGAFMAVATSLVVLAYLNGHIRQVLFNNSALIVAAFLLILLVLFLSRTRLYVATAALALVGTILLSKRGTRKWISLLVLSAVAVVIALTYNQALLFLELRGFDTGLTGRGLTWYRALNNIPPERQWLGWGFRSFEQSYFDYMFSGSYRPDHAHNSYIQAYFETGRVGMYALFLLIAVQFNAAWQASIRLNRFSYSMFMVLYVALGSLFGLNYAGAMSTILCLMFLFLAIETRETPAEPRHS